MPANLPPQYFEAEKNFRAAKTPQEKIAALEEMLAIMPKHKGTDHLHADLRARIAKLTLEAEKRPGTAKRSGKLITKEGAAQIAVVGPPNVGKSQLLCSVTNAKPLVTDYPFATTSPTPGMMEFENIKIQLIDTPPLAPQSVEWWLAHLLRKADALLIMIDLGADVLSQMDAVIIELEKMRISIGIRKTDALILSEQKALIVGNKIDLPNASANYQVLQEKYGQQFPMVAISAKERIGLEEMKHKIYQMLNVIRVYTKAPGQKPVFTDPVVLPRGSTLEQAAADVHKDFAAKLKYARLWGSGKHDGVMVKRNHVLADGDIIELHI
jgi:hypothetical protein